MCDQAKKTLPPGAPPAASPTPPAPPFNGSRRRRLWELPQQCHCPVVGVCLPLETLRRLVSKALGDRVVADDYEIHVGAIAECTRRNRLSELLQHELEQRYERTIFRFRQARSADQVMRLWQAAQAVGDVAGAFWAALTHPRCDAALQETLCRDLHMLQHQAGASVRTDVAKLANLQDENARLRQELLRAQERNVRLMAEKLAELERQGELLLVLRAQIIQKDSALAFLNADLQALKATMPDLASNQRLRQKNAQLLARHDELQAQLGAARQRLAAAGPMRETSTKPVSPVVVGSGGDFDREACASAAVDLTAKRVLCVGGRNANVPSYREQVERFGGRFAHHDGGLEGHQSALEAGLSGADLVICQTGCISHNAYWKVKEFCKRHGTRCVFVDNPSSSSFARGLAKIVDQDDPAPQVGPDGAGPPKPLASESVDRWGSVPI